MVRKTPICDAIKEYSDANPVRWHMPGHQGGRKIPEPLTGWGSEVWRYDVTEVPGLDNLLFAEDVIARSEALTAQLYGVEHSFYLTQGSTVGLHMALLACVKPGQKVLVPRFSHVSIWHALVLCGANPVYMSPDYDADGLIEPFSMGQIAKILAQDPDIKAIVLQNPTYDGKAGDMAAAVALANHYHIPLIVDEAHGAHWHFSELLPLSAVDAGADIVVQSAHKTLPALTGAAWLHIQGDRVTRDMLVEARRVLHSTSPSYLILASLDACQAYLANEAAEAYQALYSLLKTTYFRLQSFPHVRINDLNLKNQDFTKMNIHLSIKHHQNWVNISRKYGIMFEKIEGNHVLLLLTPQTQAQEIELLLQSFTESQMYEVAVSEQPALVLPQFDSRRTIMNPRSVFYADSEWIDLHTAVGRVAKDVIMHYPPGVPVIMPGEAFTIELVEYLRSQSGGLRGIAKRSNSLFVKVII